MPAPRHHRPLSALWIGALALAGAWGALGGDGIGSAPRSQATELALASGFEPDESSLPSSGAPTGGAERIDPAAPRDPGTPLALKSVHTPEATPEIVWNGHGDQAWPLPDGRTFVVSAWGATWWLGREGRLQRTGLDLSGHDPARPARYVEGLGLVLNQRDGSTRVIELSGAQPISRVLPAGSAL